MIDINFKGLFTVQVLHQFFFKDQVCNDFSISPSNITAAVIAGHRLVVKQYSNQLYAGTQSAINPAVLPPNNYKPFINIEDGMKMTFYMQLNNPLFANYTNLPAVYGTGKIFYFTNRNNNVVGANSFLSAKIAPYNSSTAYSPGDMAVDGGGIVYRAIRTSNSGNKQGLSKTAYWAKVDNNAYASGVDVLQWMFSTSTYNFGSIQPTANISVLGYDTATGDYTAPALLKTIIFPSPVNSFTLDLTSLSPGKYSLTVNGAAQWIYINDELSGGLPFGVIDIFNEGSPASCNLIDVNGDLTSPTYTIEFLNRATIWKYIINSGNSYAISDSTNSYQFSGPANVVTSLTPIPLSTNPLDINVTIKSQAIQVASADPQRFTQITQSGDPYLCSEIYLNY